ncbi:hypothetical protein F5Y18DRAFT_403819 [Xylariaceae sp. FL1019]|nr:hypothetical protein F5Y18DRAFT_403819 [Xylariaceae sp. FL1019]
MRSNAVYTTGKTIVLAFAFLLRRIQASRCLGHAQENDSFATQYRLELLTRHISHHSDNQNVSLLATPRSSTVMAVGDTTVPLDNVVCALFISAT